MIDARNNICLPIARACVCVCVIPGHGRLQEKRIPVCLKRENGDCYKHTRGPSGFIEPCHNDRTLQVHRFIVLLV